MAKTEKRIIGKGTQQAIAKRIKETGKLIKDRKERKAIEEIIKEEEERENSPEGIWESLKVHGEALIQDKADRATVVYTLIKLPYKVRRKVIDEVTFLIMGALGVTTKLCLPVVARKDDFRRSDDFYCTLVEVPVIFLNLSKTKRKSDKMDTVAHEIAHFILGHHHIMGGKRRKERVFERAADDLCEKWGFKRAYKDYSY